MQGFLIGIVLAAPLAVALYLAPKMHWYYGWPFALLCFLVSLYQGMPSRTGFSKNSPQKPLGSRIKIQTDALPSYPQPFRVVITHFSTACPPRYPPIFPVEPRP